MADTSSRIADNPLLTHLKTIVLYIVNIFIVTPILFLFYVIFYIYRWIIQLVMYFKYGGRTTLMSGPDSFMAEDYPESRLFLIGCGVLHGDVTREYLVEKGRKKFESQELVYQDLKKMLKIPIKKYGYWFWLDNDNKFDGDFHIRTLEVEDEKAIVTETDLEKWASQVANLPFPDGKPAWEFILVPNPFIYEHEKHLNTSEIEKRHLCIFRGFHCYGDGVSIFMNFLFKFFDGQVFLPPIIKPAKITFFQSCLLLLPALSYTTRILSDFINSDNNVLHNRRLSGEKICVVSGFVDLDDIKRIKQQFKFSVSAILISSLGESLYRYLKSRNLEIPDDIRLAFSIPLRFPEENDTKIETDLSFLLFPIPTSNLTPMERLKITNERFLNEARSPYVIAAKMLLKVLRNVIPSYVFTSLAIDGPMTAMVTNFPLPEKPLEKELDSILDVIPWMPNKHMTGISVIFFSFNGKFRMTVQTDKTIFPSREDVHDLLEFWHKGIDDLIRIAKEKSK